MSEVTMTWKELETERKKIEKIEDDLEKRRESYYEQKALFERDKIGEAKDLSSILKNNIKYLYDLNNRAYCKQKPSPYDPYNILNGVFGYKHTGPNILTDLDVILSWIDQNFDKYNFLVTTKRIFDLNMEDLKVLIKTPSETFLEEREASIDSVKKFVSLAATGKRQPKKMNDGPLKRMEAKRYLRGIKFQGPTEDSFREEMIHKQLTSFFDEMFGYYDLVIIHYITYNSEKIDISLAKYKEEKILVKK